MDFMHWGDKGHSALGKAEELNSKYRVKNLIEYDLKK